MRSWFGLFKTLHIATPDISNILSPFEKALAGKESKDDFEWTHPITGTSSRGTLYIDEGSLKAVVTIWQVKPPKTKFTEGTTARKLIEAFNW